jgi:hypothetical protein
MATFCANTAGAKVHSIAAVAMAEKSFIFMRIP